MLINKGKGKYSVINSQTGKVHSESTTLAKAEAQLRLLKSLKEHK
jgi:hypothetical protein